MLLAIVAATILALVVAALVYPGEFSHLSPALNRWLYDRGAGTYEKKWSAPRFRDPAIERSIARFAASALTASGTPRVLDLGCGTGRGARLLLEALPDDVRYVGVDQSAGMLDRFRTWIATLPADAARRVEIRHEPLSRWAANPGIDSYGLVLMLEVGEFLPDFAEVLGRACSLLAAGGGLVMTRPAGGWWLCFPRRRQSRRALAALLQSQGMTQAEFRPWRSRYELVFAVRQT